LSVDQLGGELSADDQRHLDGCSRCQTELRLWQEFQSSEAVDAAEAADLTTELARRLAAADPVRRSAGSAAAGGGSAGSWRRWAAAAVVVLAAGLIYGILDREPALTPGTGAPVYRGGAVELVSPRGDVDSKPARLEWREVTSAVRYDVRVFEVDGTELWSASSPVAGLAIPPDVAAMLLPGKTVSWDVSAVGQDGVVLIRSAREQFRVQPPDALF
jgi:hypothetical protein